jgi:hypothetical protein
MARLILAPNLNPVLVAACRRVEDGVWWDVLGGAIRQ